MKKTGLMAVLMALLFTGIAFAEVPAAGNKFCPVGGEPVTQGTYVEYQGKRYGLCCPMCAKKFLADPEKYLAKMAEQEAKS